MHQKNDDRRYVQQTSYKLSSVFINTNVSVKLRGNSSLILTANGERSIQGFNCIAFFETVGMVKMPHSQGFSGI